MSILDHNPDLADVIHSDSHAQALIQEAKSRLKMLDKSLSAPKPVPLLPDLETAPPYPLEALGELLGGAVVAIIESVQVPDAIAAQSVLMAAAMAAQPHGNVQRAGQLIPLSLFGLTVAESGDRKSAADRLALSAHQAHQSDLLKNHQNSSRQYRDQRDAYQKARAAILEKYRRDLNTMAAELGKLHEPTEPRSPFIFAEEPTLEGLQKSLLHGHPSQGLFSDEGAQFFGGHALKPENMLKSIAGYSKFWDGARINRIRAAEGESASRGGCRLSLHVMIQPIVAQAVLGNPLMQGQGFFARFLIAWPQSRAGSRFYRDADPARDTRLRLYWQRMKSLLALEPQLDEHNELSPPTLHLAPDALDAWIVEHDAIEAALGRGGDLQEIKPAAAKGGENLLRIAGVLAVVEDARCIDLSIVKRAGILVRWYLAEALRLTNPAKADPNLVDAQRLLDWLHSHDWQHFDARALQREGPRFVRKSATIRNTLLAILTEHSQLLTCDGKRFMLNLQASTAAATLPPALQYWSYSDKTQATHSLSPRVASVSPLRPQKI